AAGTGLTTAQLTSGLPAGFDPNVWLVTPGQTYPFLVGGPTPSPTPLPVQPIEPVPPPPPPPPQPPQPPQPDLPVIPIDQLPTSSGNLFVQPNNPADLNPQIPPQVVPIANNQSAQTGDSGTGGSGTGGSGTGGTSRSGAQQAGNGPLRPDGRP